MLFFSVFFFTGCLRFLSKGKSNYGYFDCVINGRLQCPEQQPQYDVLFLLKPNHPKCTSIHGDLLNRVRAFTIAVLHSQLKYTRSYFRTINHTIQQPIEAQ